MMQRVAIASLPGEPPNRLVVEESIERDLCFTVYSVEISRPTEDGYETFTAWACTQEDARKSQVGERVSLIVKHRVRLQHRDLLQFLTNHSTAIPITEEEYLATRQETIFFNPTGDGEMPTGTPVDRCYQKLKRKKGKASAAKICQAATGRSLKTGRKPKGKKK